VSISDKISLCHIRKTGEKDMNKSELLTTFETIAKETDLEIQQYLNEIAREDERPSTTATVLYVSMQYTNQVIRKLICHLKED